MIRHSLKPVTPANTYRDVGGRATQEATAEAEKWCMDVPFTNQRTEIQLEKLHFNYWIPAPRLREGRLRIPGMTKRM